MKAIKYALIAAAVVAPVYSFAGKVEAKDLGDGETIKTMGLSVKVSDRLTVVVEDEKINENLDLTGHSNRKSPLGTSYVIRSYVKEGKKLTAAGVLDELSKMDVKALRLNITFVIPNQSLRDKFSESLGRNDIFAEGPKADADVKALFDQLKFGVGPKDTIDFISVTRPDGTDVVNVVVQSPRKGGPNLTLTGTGKDLGLKFWKIWFGKTGDDTDMKRVQKELINEGSN